jgi:lysophospholipase L1-like esterase
MTVKPGRRVDLTRQREMTTLARRTFNRLLAVATLGLAGCGSARERPPTVGGTLRFLALGDSYTIGESVAEDQRWPVQLAKRLREAGFDVADPEIIAQTGWRTDDLDRAISTANTAGPFALVSLLIGVNNQYQGRTAQAYEPEFAALLQRAIGFAGGDASRVIVLSIPDWGATPYGRSSDPASVARQIDAFNAINRASSEKAGARYIDVTPVSRLAPQQPDLVAGDGLHPSEKMYAEWVKLALPQALAALRGDKPTIE